MKLFEIKAFLIKYKPAEEIIMTCDQFQELALSISDTIALPHFDRTAYKVVNKRIFATLHKESNTANVKLSPADQSVYCLIDKEIIYPVNNKWGLQGWTTFQLARVDSELILDALHAARNEIFKNKKS